MKKIITAAVSVLSAAALVSLTASAAGKYTVSELRGLCDSLLGKNGVTQEQDINSDGIVDVFDLVEMRGSFDHTGVFTESTFRPDDEFVRTIGRSARDENDDLWLIQSGASAEFIVSGKTVSITLCGDSYTGNSTEHQPRYGILVDGELVIDEMLGSREKTVTVFTGDEPREAVIKVIHLSEANNGAVGIRSITADSDVPVPVGPTVDKDMRITFLGDSITCAYGVEGKDQYENFKTSTENFMKSYAYLTCEKLGADCNAVAFSGYGVISGYTSSGNKNSDAIVSKYLESCGTGSYDIKCGWQKSDVVVINLGTNDNTYVSADTDTRTAEFTDAYIELLEKVHTLDPDAYIICTLGTMGCTELYPAIEEAVGSFRSVSGYDRIMCYQSATHSQADGLGSDWHPSEKTQQNSAYVLADKICQALGLESDQQGIDIAADCDYTAVQDDGAMMSAYFSDWDKSFHITTVTGGTSVQSIQAHIGELGLKKGGEYHLQFQLETSEGQEIPLRIVNKETGKVIFEDTFTGTGSKSAYEAEFSSPENASAELIFDMGGTDSLRVSLYELKIIRIG